jgi:hypothetical protein
MPQNPRGAVLNVGNFRYGRSVQLTGASFTLWGLPRGKYRLHAFASDGLGHSVTSAELDLEVSGSNADNLTLAMLPPFEVGGRIGWDGDPVSGAATIRLEPLQSGWDPVHAKIEADGTFRIAAVEPDRYRVLVEGVPEGVYVKSLKLGAQDMAGGVLDARFGGGGQPLAVTLSTAGAQISGTVQDAKGPLAGVTLAIAAADFFRTVVSGPDGSYTCRGLAPGNYQIVAIDPSDAESLKQSGSLGIYEGSAEKFHVAEGEKLVRDVKM